MGGGRPSIAASGVAAGAGFARVVVVAVLLVFAAPAALAAAEADATRAGAVCVCFAPATVAVEPPAPQPQSAVSTAAAAMPRLKFTQSIVRARPSRALGSSRHPDVEGTHISEGARVSRRAPSPLLPGCDGL